VCLYSSKFTTCTAICIDCVCDSELSIVVTLIPIFLFLTFVCVLDGLKRLSPQDISNTVWAFGILGLKHTEFLAAVNENMEFRMKTYLGGNRSPMNCFKGQEISNTLLSLASLNYTPRKLLRTVEAYVMELVEDDGKVTVPMVARIFTQQEVANLAWAVSVFGVYPQHLIEVIYVGLTGIGDRPDPLYVQQAFGNTGLGRIHIVSLLYLQTMMDLDAGQGTTCPYRLPDDFPSAWNPAFSIAGRSNGNTGDGARGGSSSGSSSVMGEDFLELNTSKSQNDVSRAFTRIGFAHVEEFVHTMEDLANDYGIQISPIPLPLISIDIANVEEKIGVEFDGPGHFITRIDGDGSTTRKSVGNFEPIIGKGGSLRYNFNWNNDCQEINGSTALKERIVEKLGWKIIKIPFWDWVVVNRDLGGVKHAEEKLCQDLLRKVEEQQQ
jgi:hypothetical protein